MAISTKKKRFGLFALGGGLTWFFVSTNFIIPIFSDNKANVERHIERFDHLGNTFSEIIYNLISVQILI